MRRSSAGVLLSALLSLLPGQAGAQGHPFPVSPADSWSFRPGHPARARDSTAASSSAGVGAALRSLALPGWGQHELGQSRKWVYGVVEVAVVSYYVERRAGGAALRRDYRNLAWDVARVHAGARQEGDFDYYERLTKWTRSGAYDADPRTGLQPETDPATFNGSVWALARGIFLPGGGAGGEGEPGYEAALDYYRARAYGPAFLWDWTGALERQEEYRGLIERSDAHFRAATTMLGVLALNHLLSGVDAFVSGRLRGLAVETALLASPGPGGSSVTFRGRLTGLP